LGQLSAPQFSKFCLVNYFVKKDNQYMKETSGALLCQFRASLLPSIVGSCVFLSLFMPAIASAHEGHDHNAEAELQQLLFQMGLDAQGNPLPTTSQAGSPTLPLTPAAAPAAIPNQPTITPTIANPALETPANATPATTLPPTNALPPDASAPAVEAPAKSKTVDKQSIGLTTPKLSPNPQLVAQATPSQGQWSSKIPFPSVPVAAALLPNGKVLTWASWDRLTFGGANTDKTYTALFDPTTNQITESFVTNTGHDMFCPGTAMLADGRLLVNGGGPVVTSTSIFNASTNSWARSGDMAQQRWYNVSATLQNGDVFTLGGDVINGTDGRGERWNGSTWRTLTNAVMTPLLTNEVENYAQRHPQFFLAPNGKLFVPGPTPNMQWYDVSANGVIQAAGQLGTEFKGNGTFTMYDVGKLLVAGGNPIHGSAQSPSIAKAYTIDINNNRVQAKQVPSMKYPRAYASSVIMPDGKVMIVGGIDNGLPFSDTGAILTPELYDPATNTWTLLAPMATPRTYHSVALLLPDGRVFAGGGGLCGDCTVNHPDAEIFTPPYLLRGSRPQIFSAPGAIGYQQKFTVKGSNDITKFTLIRLSSVTHSVNTDQRFMKIPFTRKQTGSYRLDLDSTANITPPGYYMLFALNSQGVPSISKIIKVGN
jgi:galactose oxidase